jgi:hypothetical protein
MWPSIRELRPASFESHCIYRTLEGRRLVAFDASQIEGEANLFHLQKTTREWVNWAIGYPSPGLRRQGTTQKITSVLGFYAVLSMTANPKGLYGFNIAWAQGGTIYQLGVSLVGVRADAVPSTVSATNAIRIAEKLARLLPKA